MEGDDDDAPPSLARDALAAGWGSLARAGTKLSPVRRASLWLSLSGSPLVRRARLLQVDLDVDVRARDPRARGAPEAGAAGASGAAPAAAGAEGEPPPRGRVIEPAPALFPSIALATIVRGADAHKFSAIAFAPNGTHLMIGTRRGELTRWSTFQARDRARETARETARGRERERAREGAAFLSPRAGCARPSLLLTRVSRADAARGRSRTPTRR